VAAERRGRASGIIEFRYLQTGSANRPLFNTRLAEDSQAKGKWHSNEGGVYYAVGIGGAVLGRGGHVILIDDPFPTMEAAQSEIERKRMWEWYTGTIYNRLMPGRHRRHQPPHARGGLERPAPGDASGRWRQSSIRRKHRRPA
jgi:hypothetical protein